jgi:hypothetical protein
MHDVIGAKCQAPLWERAALPRPIIRQKQSEFMEAPGPCTWALNAGLRLAGPSHHRYSVDYAVTAVRMVKLLALAATGG